MGFRKSGFREHGLTYCIFLELSTHIKEKIEIIDIYLELHSIVGPRQVLGHLCHFGLRFI